MLDGLEKSDTHLSTTHQACFSAFSARVENSIGESLSNWSDLQAGNAGEHFRRSYASKTATKLMQNSLFAIRPNNCDEFSMQFSTASLFQLLHEIQARLVHCRGACTKGSPSGDLKHAFSTARWKSTEAGLLKRGLLHGLAGTYCTPQRHVASVHCNSVYIYTFACASMAAFRWRDQVGNDRSICKPRTMMNGHTLYLPWISTSLLPSTHNYFLVVTLQRGVACRWLRTKSCSSAKYD